MCQQLILHKPPDLLILAVKSSNMRRFNRVYLLGLFALAICLPFLNDTFKFIHFERADENRKFHDSLTFDIRHLDDFPEASEEYLADNFSFRTPLIQWSKQLKFRVFKVSPNPDKLIIGPNGRYFIADDENGFTKAISISHPII